MNWRLLTASTLLLAGLGALPAHAAVVSDLPVALTALDGQTVIYQHVGDAPGGKDGTGGTPRLYRHDLRTGARTELVTQGIPQALTFSGSHVAYTTSNSISIQGLDTGSISEAATGSAVVTPRLAGGKLIYAKVQDRFAYRSGDFLLYSGGATKALGHLNFGTLDIPRPVTFDGRLMAYTESGAATAMDVETGKIYRQPAVTGAFAVGIGNSRVVYLKPVATEGTYTITLWHPEAGGYREMGRLDHPVGVEPVVYGDAMAWADREGAVRLLDLRTGEVRVLVADGTPKRSVQVSDSFVTYVGDGGRLYAVSHAAAPAQAAVFHTVQTGDLLWRVAAQHGVSLADLVRTNNLLNPNLIWPGQRLFLPHPVSPRYETYTVQAGDTLAKIAVQYRTTFESISQRNGLKSSTLYVGQKLQVGRGPDASGGEYRDYAVMPGDTWQSIAGRLGIAADTLLKVNNLTGPVPLMAGQPVRLPRS